MRGPVETAILISGRGSNMSALIAAATEPEFPARVRVVVADRADAAGLAHARDAGVEAFALDPRDSRAALEAALDEALRARGVELICLAGFMRILSAGFCARWSGRAINIHPSLLPAYRGLDTHARALADGVRVHGCTVHWVTAKLDAGEIIAQSPVPVLAGDTAETLAARVLEAEHALYPAALRLAAASVVDQASGPDNIAR